MKKVVSNTTPLIGLAMVGRFEVLKILFQQIYIPSAVYHEVTMDAGDKPGIKETKSGVSEGWIQVVNVNPTGILTTLQVDLDPGESEAIAWAFENQSDLLLIDEYKGRAKATGLGLNLTGTIGVLLLARQAKLLGNIRTELDLLRTQGFRISDSLYKKVLELN